MDVRGFNLSSGLSAAAEGSLELGLRLKEASRDKPYHLKFCTASYKDAGQLRARFRRRGEATLRPYEQLSEDDLSDLSNSYNVRFVVRKTPLQIQPIVENGELKIYDLSLLKK